MRNKKGVVWLKNLLIIFGWLVHINIIVLSFKSK